MSVTEGLKSALEAIYEIQNTKRILIVQDKHKKAVVDAFEDAILKSKFDGEITNFEIDNYKRPLKEIPTELDHIINEIQPDLTITLFEAFSEERPMRIQLLTELEKIGKIAHCPGITEEMLRNNGPFDINYTQMKQDALRLKNILKNYNVFKVLSGPNREYELDLFIGDRRWLDDLTVEERGFGNLPAGEIFTGPIEDMTNGKMYVEYRAGEHLLKEPVIVTWENGKVVNIESKDKEMEKILKEGAKMYKYGDVIGELGLGFNINSNPTAEILESEKRGLHIARGPSREFGSIYYCNDHEDYLLTNAKLIAIKKGNFRLIYDKGKLLI